MKDFIKLLVAFTAIAIFSSCEKVIDLPVADATPHLVVEGNVFDGPGPFTVHLTRTASFYNSDPPPSVQGAHVRISDSVGNSEDLSEGANGIYTASALTGVPGRTYFLDVESEGKTYTASNTMPEPDPIDSITYEYLDSTDYAFLDTEDFGQYLTMYHTDPAGIDNFYQVRLYKNSELDKPHTTKNTYSDRLFDGLQRERRLLGHPFHPGDTVTVELWSIDRAAYDFYTTLNSVSDNNGGGPFAGVPDNPITNLTNGAYGFFGASAVTQSTVVIQ